MPRKSKSLSTLFLFRFFSTYFSPFLLFFFLHFVFRFDDIQGEFDAREEKMKKLEAAVEAGGVKGASAKSELEQFKLTDMTDEQKKKLIQATAR